MRMGLKEGTSCSRVRKLLFTVSPTVSHHSEIWGMYTTLGTLRRASRKTYKRSAQAFTYVWVIFQNVKIFTETYLHLQRCLLPEHRTPPVSWHWRSTEWASPGSALVACPGGGARQEPSGSSVQNRASRPAAGEDGRLWAVGALNWKQIRTWSLVHYFNTFSTTMKALYESRKTTVQVRFICCIQNQHKVSNAMECLRREESSQLTIKTTYMVLVLKILLTY